MPGADQTSRSQMRDPNQQVTQERTEQREVINEVERIVEQPVRPRFLSS